MMMVLLKNRKNIGTTLGNILRNLPKLIYCSMWAAKLPPLILLLITPATLSDNLSGVSSRLQVEIPVSLFRDEGECDRPDQTEKKSISKCSKFALVASFPTLGLY